MLPGEKVDLTMRITLQRRRRRLGEQLPGPGSPPSASAGPTSAAAALPAFRAVRRRLGATLPGPGSPPFAPAGPTSAVAALATVPAVPARPAVRKNTNVCSEERASANAHSPPRPAASRAVLAAAQEHAGLCTHRRAAPAPTCEAPEVGRRARAGLGCKAHDAAAGLLGIHRRPWEGQCVDRRAQGAAVDGPGVLQRGAVYHEAALLRLPLELPAGRARRAGSAPAAPEQAAARGLLSAPCQRLSYALPPEGVQVPAPAVCQPLGHVEPAPRRAAPRERQARRWLEAGCGRGPQLRRRDRRGRGRACTA